MLSSESARSTTDLLFFHSRNSLNNSSSFFPSILTKLLQQMSRFHTHLQGLGKQPSCSSSRGFQNLELIVRMRFKQCSLSVNCKMSKRSGIPEELVKPISIPDEELSIVLDEPFQPMEEKAGDDLEQLVEPICILDPFISAPKRAKEVIVVQ